MRHECRADFAIAGHEMQRRSGHANAMQEADRFGGNQRRLLGRFGDGGISRREGRGDLAGEDRQRKIPRADADEHAAPAIGEIVGLAGRPRHTLRHKRAPRF